MIKHTTIVICDACGKCVPAKDEGNQRDSNWVAPSDWMKGAYNSNVHFCPECHKKLSSVSYTNVQYRGISDSASSIRTTVDAMHE